MAAEKGKITVDLNTRNEQVKKKRGRPLKSEAAGIAGASQALMSTVSSPPAMSAVPSTPIACQPLTSAVASMPMRGVVVSPPLPRVVSQESPAFNLSPSAETSVQGRGRGRSPGSQNPQMLASMSEILANTAAVGFRVHLVQINSGEDVNGKIMSLVQNGPRGIFIISANGTVSSAAISYPGSSGVVTIHEGQFQILSLAGSFTVAETGLGRCRTGGFSVSLAGPDGSVIGGAVAGQLIAASAVQAVVGSFIPNDYKRKQQPARPNHDGGRDSAAKNPTPDIICQQSGAVQQRER